MQYKFTRSVKKNSSISGLLLLHTVWLTRELDKISMPLSNRGVESMNSDDTPTISLFLQGKCTKSAQQIFMAAAVPVVVSYWLVDRNRQKKHVIVQHKLSGSNSDTPTILLVSFPLKNSILFTTRKSSQHKILPIAVSCCYFDIPVMLYPPLHYNVVVSNCLVHRYW